MKKFELFRYLKKFSLLIFLVSLAGAMLIYAYANNKQQYTASLVIRYTNSEIKDGLTPNGQKLDVNEIYSSSVISQAMEILGNPGTLNVIRSRCSVQEVLSDEQKQINEAIIAKGEEVTYFPDTYRVKLVVSGKYGATYARNVLDAIMQSYCTYYTENYVEQKLSLNPSSNLIESGYDYYECIRILENDTNDMLNFLKTKKDAYPSFRSSKTGYSYADLYDIYQNFKQSIIPQLYARVLAGPQVRNGEVLRNFLANSIASSEQQEKLLAERREKINTLLAQYVEKNTGILSSYFTEQEENVSSNYILKEIEQAGAGSKAETTYDGLVLEMVDINRLIAADSINREFQSEILSTFQAVGSQSGADAEHEELEKLISNYENALEKYYEIVNLSSKELNLFISADYLKMVSSVRVAPAVNLRLYLMLALALFFVIGCCGAVVLGRTGDIVDYMLYTDKKTGLPNREKLNVHIDGLARKILPDNFTCFALRLDNLTELSKKYGYAVGDSVLKDFADLVKLMGDTDGMVGYNGIGKFVAFFDECSDRKAAAVLRILSNQVAEYNKLNPEYPIRFTAAYATTTVEENYDVRALLRIAQGRLEVTKSSIAEDAADFTREDGTPVDASAANTAAEASSATQNEASMPPLPMETAIEQRARLIKKPKESKREHK